MPSKPLTDPARRHLLGAASTCATVAALPALLTACGGGSSDGVPPAERAPVFSHEGLDRRIVLRLRPAGGGLLAATDAGLYQRQGDGRWRSRQLDGLHVFDVVAVTAAHWLASVRDASQVDAPPRLLETLDGGGRWHELTHDFGGAGGPEAIQALLHDAAAGRLLATGADVLAVSHDLGRHWQRLAGAFHSFTQPKAALAVDPRLGDVWFGGQDAIERLTLFRWRQSDGRVIEHPELMTTPSVAKGIRFSQDQPGRVLVAGEGGIVHSPDLGGTWASLLSDGHHFHFDVVQDPHRPRRWVTARWEKRFDEPQPLVVRVSDDDGKTWRDHVHGDTRLFGGTWSLAAMVEGGRTRYCLGLYKGGVMRLDLA